ncbi:hypothetical protein [Microbacterium sp. NPDC077057]|uniref:hypothetical protein n=1 Tax=unclassified Microbacterium TaxID=2609290 RepID=UPI0034201FAB
MIVVDAAIVVDLVCTGMSTRVLQARLEDEFLLPLLTRDRRLARAASGLCAVEVPSP